MSKQLKIPVARIELVGKSIIDDKIKRKVPKPGLQLIEFDIRIKRSILDHAQTSFECDMPYTIMLCGSDQFHNDILNTITIGSKYKNEYSLMGLLDFAQRNEYKVTAKNNNESFNHGLNVSLHDYQLQSLQWMIDEENDPLGFYRHFYKKGKFADKSSFLYSATLNNLIVNESLPVAHGGFLCEEMGLGKTIISLALINCNKPTYTNGYSTKK